MLFQTLNTHVFSLSLSLSLPSSPPTSPSQMLSIFPVVLMIFLPLKHRLVYDGHVNLMFSSLLLSTCVCVLQLYGGIIDPHWAAHKVNNLIISSIGLRLWNHQQNKDNRYNHHPPKFSSTLCNPFLQLLPNLPPQATTDLLSVTIDKFPFSRILYR